MFKNKWVLVFLGVLACTVLGFIGLSVYFSLKLRDIKTPLLEAFKSQIEGDLQIGSADVVFFPAGINLQDVKLFASGQATPSASIRRAELRFNLLPLIQKKIETRVTILQPDILLKRGKDGKTNMEQIFAPMLARKAKGAVSPIDKLWWKRLAVNKLAIQDAHFKSTEEGSPEVTELNHLSVEADHIRFESAQEPAELKIRYDLPRISKETMKLETQLVFDESRQNLTLHEGQLQWGPARMHIGGEVVLPQGEQKDVSLNLNFESEPIDLKKLAKILLDPFPAMGKVQFKGTVTGTAFAPILNLVLDSANLQLSGKTLSNLHAELMKKEKPIEIVNTSFGIYGGTVGLSGQATRTGNFTSANLGVNLNSLSLAAMSGKKGSSARLNGSLQLAIPDIKTPSIFSGAGKISVGPFPLPVVNLQNKVRVADILSSGTALGQMVNVGMLASSANVIGTQVDQVNALVRISGGNISLAPFSMGNGHFTASGSGTLHQQKSINASGTFTLNRNVTAQLITGPVLRQVLTNGTGALSFPFSMSGSLDDPNVSVDSAYLKGLVAKAAAMGITNLLAGGVRPGAILQNALKNAPLGEAKGPLGQILGGMTQPPASSSSSNRKTGGAQKKNSGGLERFLFGQ